MLKISAFMSGTGTNLRKIIEHSIKTKSFEIVMIFTDTKDGQRCKASEIAAEFAIPLVVRDISDFYAERGLSTRKDMKIREEYDLLTLREIEKSGADIVCLTGYMSIVTSVIHENYLTLNVHPADLTKKSPDGKRLYAGCMGADCIRKAALNGEQEVRSSLHVVTDDVDGGQVVAMSKPVLIHFDARGIEPEQLDEECDILLKQLKEKGDWIIYPKSLQMIAEGKMRLEPGYVIVDGGVYEDGYRF